MKPPHSRTTGSPSIISTLGKYLLLLRISNFLDSRLNLYNVLLTVDINPEIVNMSDVEKQY